MLVLFPDLYIGIILAVLKALGKIPSLIESLNNFVSGSANISLFSLMILTGISSILHFLFFSFVMAFMVSLIVSIGIPIE